jgi:response regulator RpfG family c-di-GMP phosphodiesterase
MLYRQPEKLSAEELNLLSDNLVSLRELLNLAGFSPAITEAVYHLYENYDGSGVPEGRKEEEIPLLSRLTRVLERYLLLTSWKENTEPLTDRDAIEEIRRQSGSLYDPRAVELLAQIILPGENFGEKDYEDKVNQEMTVLEPGQAAQEEADINNIKASEGETVDRQ